MDMVLTIAGIAVVVIGLRDMFHTLLHPRGRGRVSRWVLAGVWRLSQLTHHRLGSAVGPAAMVVVVLLWVALQGVGWALIYYPHIPGGFVYSAGVNPADYPDFGEALYVSLVTLGTLGYGDVVPVDPWIRVVSPIQGLIGFALLTAALTWFTQVYPPLSRRRALALELGRLADTSYAEAIGEVDPATAARVLDSLAAEVGKVRVDFIQHTEGFYFQEQSTDLSLARQLPYALHLRDRALTCQEAAVRVSAQQLSLALEQLGAELKKDFRLTGDTPGEVFAAYASEHTSRAQL
ncbi:potassium channel family protein [Marisediminicola antarctica]|uniref:Transporter n=1 Tax=Marisediminicola antarctica TaxID=674079 RepID=A0A7L5AKY9_9MICO|nr:potassium channel family protein [Marisediminicola antarctica]QHO70465.1 transporter [Marisediminicola antarctica]